MLLITTSQHQLKSEILIIKKSADTPMNTFMYK